MYKCEKCTKIMQHRGIGKHFDKTRHESFVYINKNKIRQK